MGKQRTRYAAEYWLKKQAAQAVDRALRMSEPVSVKYELIMAVVMRDHYLTQAAAYLVSAEAMDRRIQELKK